jgi:hypothetical protein
MLPNSWLIFYFPKMKNMLRHTSRPAGLQFQVSGPACDIPKVATACPVVIACLEDFFPQRLTNCNRGIITACRQWDAVRPGSQLNRFKVSRSFTFTLLGILALCGRHLFPSGTLQSGVMKMVGAIWMY